MVLSLFFPMCAKINRTSLCVLSGHSPRALTLDFLEGRGYTAEKPPSVFDALNVTVPGAPACWCDTVQLLGSHKVYLCLSSISVTWECFIEHSGSPSEINHLTEVNTYKPCRSDQHAQTCLEIGLDFEPKRHQQRMEKLIIASVEISFIWSQLQ